jgi:Ulp1 family protease
VREDMPTQRNGYDCGVFALAAAKAVFERRKELEFSQQHMSLFRKVVAHAFLRQTPNLPIKWSSFENGTNK